MIDSWTWQISFSLVIGLAAFLAVLLPVLLLQYSRFGRLSPARLLGAAALSVYAVALVAYTLLPLPDGSTCDGRSGGILQPVPLATLADFGRLAAEHGPTSSLVLATAAQPVLNVALFVPLGVLVRAMAGRGVTVATLTGAAVSLLIETTQYTGVFGLVDCSYRIADVDDLLTNTGGALLGALLAPIVAGWIPHPAALAALPPRPVTRPRRLLGMALDAALLSVAPVALVTATILAGSAGWALVTGSCARCPSPASGRCCPRSPPCSTREGCPCCRGCSTWRCGRSASPPRCWCSWSAPGAPPGCSAAPSSWTAAPWQGPRTRRPRTDRMVQPQQTLSPRAGRRRHPAPPGGRPWPTP